MSDQMNRHYQKKLGLVLGGGGARGLAHIGILKVLEEENIKISSISGCSMGGLVGALYAIGYSINELIDIVEKHTTIREIINIVDRTPRRRGLIVGQRLRTLLTKLIGDETTFGDTKIPLTLNAVDLITSSEVILTEGRLIDAVMATIAIPGVFMPVSIGEYLLIDGGTLNNLPIENIHQFQPDVSIAVDVHPDIKKEIPWQISGQKPKILVPVPDTFLDFYRAQLIMISRLTEVNLETSPADLVLRPVLPPEITMFYGYHHAHRLIAIGEKTAIEMIDQIKSLVIE